MCYSAARLFWKQISLKMFHWHGKAHRCDLCVNCDQIFIRNKINLFISIYSSQFIHGRSHWQTKRLNDKQKFEQSWFHVIHSLSSQQSVCQAVTFRPSVNQTQANRSVRRPAWFSPIQSVCLSVSQSVIPNSQFRNLSTAITGVWKKSVSQSIVLWVRWSGWQKVFFKDFAENVPMTWYGEDRIALGIVE